ncbi:MAG: undecaprenyl/decaprenyl-phosphate alpha-N-acetylglucosaminyl 1-phosphate transferase [Deltaproteobacteria bacterium]|nr:undecaprenyl/decaprenyl-phosphate alpha-N-acetylglucosaminyl 1-phosphate transferase [Deltaproteobacteria bacterium]MBW2658200.1 undecaprenyl/decaprenyl-phosphate alpha-N-acetylglucosaminyl 1-phosphate transferase [Deltaproteobacteria bacterium]
MTIELREVATFLAAFFAAVVILPNLSRFGMQIGLVDIPNERKVHDVPKPLVGGIGIVIAATFSILAFVPSFALGGYYAGMILLLLIGVMDDLYDLGHRKKFLAQIVATTLLIYLSNINLSNFGNLIGLGKIVIPDIGWLIWGVTVFSVVGVTNAVNMIDGLDGLAGSISFVSFITFAALSVIVGDSNLMLVNLALAGAIFGFLRYNWSPAALFMGDAGSLCLGFSLSFMALALTQSGLSPVPPVSVLLVMGVPISDTLIVMIRRICKGRSPFKPDNTHLHHILLQHGLDGRKPVTVMLFLSVVFCGISILGVMLPLPEPLLFAVFGIYFIINWFADYFTGKLVLLLKAIQQGGGLSASRALRQTPLNGEKRYNVDIQVHYDDYPSKLSLPGKITNISKAGFWAHIDRLGVVCNECVVTISFPGVRDLRPVEMPVEHLWMSAAHNNFYHGFKFLELAEEQEYVLSNYIDSLEKQI